MANKNGNGKSLESWIWDAACSIRGAKDAPKFIPDEGISRIVETLIGWKEEEKFSRIVDHAELKKNDYNISPSRYIYTGEAETYRPIAEIVEEVNAIEEEAKATDKALREIRRQLGVGI